MLPHFFLNGSSAKWKSGWISNLILYLSGLDGSYLFWKRKLRCWPHRVGKIEHMAVVKDKTLSVIRRKGAGQANEGKGQALTQEYSILPALLRTQVLFVATRATCRRVERYRNHFPLSPEKGKHLIWAACSPVREWISTCFSCGLVKLLGVRASKN